MTEKTLEQLDLEIEELNNLFHGLDYYLNQGGHRDVSKKTIALFDEWWAGYSQLCPTVEQKLKVIHDLEALLAETKEAVVSLGISAKDITDKELKRYNIMLESEIEHPNMELRKDFPKGPKSFKLH